MSKLIDKMKEIWKATKEAIAFERAIQKRDNEKLKQKMADMQDDTIYKGSTIILTPKKYREYKKKFDSDGDVIDMKTGKYKIII